MNIRLLHNMSVPPRTVLFHAAEQTTRSYGFGLVFRVTLPDWDNDPQLLAESLGIPVPDGVTAEMAVRQRLHEHSGQIPLPEACMVTSRPVTSDQECTCNLAAAAVMSKSSGHIFLRDKQPSLFAIGGPIVLLLRNKSSVGRILTWIRRHDPLEVSPDRSSKGARS